MDQGFPRKKEEVTMAFDQAIVGYLPKEITGEDLKKIFTEYGNIKCLYLCVEFEPLSNFAHIQFEDENNASRAFRVAKSEGISFNGTQLTVTPISEDYAPIKILPVPCLIQVLSGLPPIEKLMAEGVCRHWKQYAPLLWTTKKVFHEIKENNSSKMSDAKFEKIITSSGPCLRDIDCLITSPERLSLMKDLCINVETLVLDFSAILRKTQSPEEVPRAPLAIPRRREARDQIFHQDPQQNPEMRGVLGAELIDPIVVEVPREAFARRLERLHQHRPNVQREQNPEMRELFGAEFFDPIVAEIPRDALPRRLERLQQHRGNGQRDQEIIRIVDGLRLQHQQRRRLVDNDGLEVLARPHHQNPQILIRPQQQNAQRQREELEAFFNRIQPENPLRPGLINIAEQRNARGGRLLIPPLDPQMQGLVIGRNPRRRQVANIAPLEAAMMQGFPYQMHLVGVAPFVRGIPLSDAQSAKKMDQCYDDLSVMFAKMKRLKRIALKNIDEQKEYKVIEHLADDLLELHLFVDKIFSIRRFLRRIDTTMDFRKFRRLRALTLNGFRINKNNLKGFGDLMNLTYLRLDGCSLDSNNLECLKEFMKLRHLSIPAMNVSDKILYHIARNNANLKFLNISNNSSITDISLKQVFALPQLTELRMDGARDAMFQFMEIDAEIIENLEILHCPNCCNLGDDPLVKLIELSPKLRWLNVAKCDITADFFERVQLVTKKRDNAVNLKLFAGFTALPNNFQLEASSNLSFSTETLPLESLDRWNGFYDTEYLESFPN